ncbi:CDGSH iron-sulfur domain-containing protein [bacterium]|nr:CDGSH iron-sulfur domain-containing protein [bacterium]
MKFKRYEHGDVTVEYGLARCIHAAECVRGLPAVFDPERRPWVDPSRADADAIVEVVRRCPSGALRAHVSGAADETPDASAVLRVVPDGPVHARGPIRLTLPGGETVDEPRLALCRCGQSKNKPYCDYSHVKAGFRDPGRLGQGKVKPGPETDPSVVEIRGVPNGPLLVNGSITVLAADGQSMEGTSCALCRCGESGAKPFCDGTHKKTGFSAE